MAEITAGMVKDLREKTGVGMMDCKAALAATDGDLEAAIDWLRAKGLAKAAKKSGRVAAEGLVGLAVKGTRGAVVEVNSETDFVARNEKLPGNGCTDLETGTGCQWRSREAQGWRNIRVQNIQSRPLSPKWWRQLVKT